MHTLTLPTFTVALPSHSRCHHARPDTDTASIQVLYDPEEVTSLATSASELLRHGGTLLLADPADGRAEGCRSAATKALQSLGAQVTEVPLEAPLASGEALILLRAVFASTK